MSGKHVVVCYARSEKERVRPIVAALEARFDVWWDADLQPGETYRATIERQIDEAACVIALWTRDSVRSTWVMDEADRAGARLLSVTLDDVRPPLGHGQRQALDLAGWDGATADPRFAALCEGIERMRPRIARIADARERRGPRPRLTRAGAAAVFLLIAASAAVALRAWESRDRADPAIGWSPVVRAGLEDADPSAAAPATAMEEGEEDAGPPPAGAAAFAAEPEVGAPQAPAETPWKVLADGDVLHRGRIWRGRTESSTFADADDALRRANRDMPAGEAPWRLPRVDELWQLVELIEAGVVPHASGDLVWSDHRRTEILAVAFRVTGAPIGPWNASASSVHTLRLVREAE